MLLVALTLTLRKSEFCAFDIWSQHQSKLSTSSNPIIPMWGRVAVLKNISMSREAVFDDYILYDRAARMYLI